MDSIFSSMCLKRGAATLAVIDALKSDLNSLLLKWNELNLSCAPKFYILHKCAPFYLETLNRFYDMGKDATERWHQMRMRCHLWIEGLKGLVKKEQSG